MATAPGSPASAPRSRRYRRQRRGLKQRGRPTLLHSHPRLRPTPLTGANDRRQRAGFARSTRQTSLGAATGRAYHRRPSRVGLSAPCVGPGLARYSERRAALPRATPSNYRVEGRRRRTSSAPDACGPVAVNIAGCRLDLVPRLGYRPGAGRRATGMRWRTGNAGWGGRSVVDRVWGTAERGPRRLTAVGGRSVRHGARLPRAFTTASRACHQRLTRRHA